MAEQLIDREEAARVAEAMRPRGGRLWTDEQLACFEALTDCAANIRALPAREWQPIETAPKDGSYVLLWLSGDGHHGPRHCNVVVGVHTDSGWYYIADGSGGKTSDEPSHWMPLPDPPKVSDVKA